MKKLIFVLAIFIVAPAFAELAVTLDYNQPNGTVTINYTGADANAQSTMPRAFALDITIDSPGTITDVSGYKNDWVHDANGEDEEGESNSLYRGFGIYPARISWWMKPGDDSCDVNSWGTPLADDTNDPGAGDGLGNSHIVLELASLYYDKVNAPPSNGTLCVLDVACNDGEDLNLHMTDEDTYRGGLVFENGDLGDIDVNIIVCPGAGCAEPNQPTTPTPAHNAIGVSTFPTKPTLSWLPAAGGVNPRYDVYFGTEATPVVVVSPNQTGLSYVATTAVQGKTYYWKIMAKNDCNSTGVSSAIWKFNTECLIGGNAGTGEYAKWVEYSRPDCWCYKKQCRGDADGKKTTLKPVMGPDLTVFKAAYNKSKAIVKTIMVGTVPGVCADFDHKDTTLKPVMGPDLTIFKNYYNDADALVPVCNVAPVITGPVNFWMN
jgi:hypothetical protein